MGKKRIITKSEESPASKSSSSQKPVKPAVARRGIARGNAYIQATYNNTKITITDEKGDVIAWSSAGSVGFSGTKKATPFAAARVAEHLAEKMRKAGIQELMVFVKGIGSGRDSAIRALANQGFAISRIKDVTPIPHNGPRPRKPRRV